MILAVQYWLLINWLLIKKSVQSVLVYFKGTRQQINEIITKSQETQIKRKTTKKYYGLAKF